MRDVVPSEDQGVVRVITGEDYILKLPGGEFFDISLHEDWDGLSSQQQYFFSYYVNNHRQKTLAMLQARVKNATFETWMNEDARFRNFLSFVDRIFVEGLKALNFLDATTNSKIRSMVLAAEGAEGYKKEKVPNNHVHNTLVVAGGLQEVLKAVGTNETSPKVPTP